MNAIVDPRSTRQLRAERLQGERALREAQSLRYRVFSSEFDAQLNGAELGLDMDDFDIHCRHIGVRDLASGELVATTRLLEVQCDLTDRYLIGHVRRIGLAGDHTPPDTLTLLLPTIRYDVKFESDRIRDAGFTGFHRLRERASVAENTASLTAFLDVPEAQAQEIAATPDLFAD